jgi:hypothetical protein
MQLAGLRVQWKRRRSMKIQTALQRQGEMPATLFKRLQSREKILQRITNSYISLHASQAVAPDSSACFPDDLMKAQNSLSIP